MGCTLALSSAIKVHAQHAVRPFLRKFLAIVAKRFCNPLYRVVQRPRHADIIVTGQSSAGIRKCLIIVIEMTKHVRSVRSWFKSPVCAASIPSKISHVGYKMSVVATSVASDCGAAVISAGRRVTDPSTAKTLTSDPVNNHVVNRRKYAAIPISKINVTPPMLVKRTSLVKAKSTSLAPAKRRNRRRNARHRNIPKATPRRHCRATTSVVVSKEIEC